MLSQVKSSQSKQLVDGACIRPPPAARSSVQTYLHGPQLTVQCRTCGWWGTNLSLGMIKALLVKELVVLQVKPLGYHNLAGWTDLNLIKMHGLVSS